MNLRGWFALSTLVVASLACGMTSPAQPTVFALPATPAFVTAAPALPAPALPATEAPAGGAPATEFRDDFDGTLGPGWQWVGEDTGTWSLTAAPGYMRLPAGNSNINDRPARNFLVRQAPQGNFEIETSTRFTPTARYQIAGLLVYDSQGNALQFGPAYAACPGGFEGGCVYFDSYQGGQFIEPNFATDVGGVVLSFLKLRREGSTYTASYSADGASWQVIGSRQSNITPRFVGLLAAQGYDAQESADFDYFTLRPLP